MKDFDGLLRSIGATESYNLPMPTDIRRRDLLRGASAATALSYSRVLGANDKIQLGVIGCGERGRHDMSQFMMVPAVNVTAVCDIYGEQIDKARQKATDAKNFRSEERRVGKEGRSRWSAYH